jgi:beta-N-acetylhexosaminidase
VAALRDGIVRAVHLGELPEERLAEAASRVRALARRPAGTSCPDGAGPPVDLDPVHGVSRLGLDTARRALRVVPGGDPPARPVLTGPPLVVRMTARPHQAIGDTAPYGPGEALTARLPGTRTVVLDPEGHELPDLGPRGGGPVVVVTHDAHRHGWMRDGLAEALRRRPDAVVIETGLPGPPSGAVHLATYGDSRVSALAAAEWLTGS